MVEILRPQLDRRGKKGGQAKLSVEDQLLVVMEYWREYRTHFHIGVSWGIDETTVGRIIRKVEDILVKCGKFRLPSKRQLYQQRCGIEVTIVDAGEVEIERPKKSGCNRAEVSSACVAPSNKSDITAASRSVTRSKHKC
jgi:hypothetical protein